jgi:RNA polymerase sigma factor (sigma-70 family)
MEAFNRKRWIEHEVVPWEQDVRRWLRCHDRGLSADEINDILQESWARICRIDCKTVRSAKSFLFAVVCNVHGDEIRRTGLVRESLAKLQGIESSEAPDLEQSIQASQLCEHLEKAINQLTPQQRAVFVARKIAGLSTRETAQRLGLAVRTVENHLRMALARLTKSLFPKVEIDCSKNGRARRARPSKQD